VRFDSLLLSLMEVVFDLYLVAEVVADHRVDVGQPEGGVLSVYWAIAYASTSRYSTPSSAKTDNMSR
jgi:hypothetical protein